MTTLRIRPAYVFAFIAAFGAVAGCGAKSPVAPDPVPTTQAFNYMMLVGLPNNGDSGSVVATLDVPSSLLASTTGASVPKVLVPVAGATLTLKNGTVVPLTGSIDSVTLKATLTSANGFYRITLDLSKDKKNPDGTFTTSDGKVGGIAITNTVAPATPKFWCGTFSGDEKGWVKLQSNFDGTGSGTFNFQFDDGSGVVSVKDQKAQNNTLTLAFTLPDGGSASGSGTILGGVNISGLWNNSFGQKGIWSASTFGCS
jgi:hypothetical protein